VQIKHGADALCNKKEGTRIAELHASSKSVIRLIQRNLKVAVIAVHRNGAKTEQILIFGLALGLPGKTPYLRRGSMIDLTNAGIESAHASEARSYGNL